MHARVSAVLGNLIDEARRSWATVRKCLGLGVTAFATTAALGGPAELTGPATPASELRRGSDLPQLASDAVRPGGNTVALGDTYGIGTGGWAADGTNGHWISDIGGTLMTFDGAGAKDATASHFGQPAERMEYFEDVESLGGGRYEISLYLVARDTDGLLTNWFSDGSSAAVGVPFSMAAFSIAELGSPADRLSYGAGEGVLTLESAEYWFVGTGGSGFGPNGAPFQWNDSSTSEGISGYAYVNIDGDLSTFTVGGEEFAGFAMLFTVGPATVPEPTGAALATALAALAAVRRRL